MNIIITITQEEKAVLDSWLGVDKIQEWLQHALDNKIRQRVDASILESTNLNPKKLSKVDKLAELAKIELKRKEDRDGVV